MKRLISILCLCFLIALPAFCADFYVSTAGSDSNPGTQAQPFATIQHAIDMCPASPGQGTVHLDSSNWNESPNVYYKYLTIIGDYAGPNGQGGRYDSIINGTITITEIGSGCSDTIKFVTSRKIVIYVSTASEVIIDSCDITYSPTEGITTSGSGPYIGVIIENCLIAYCNSYGIKTTSPTGGLAIINCVIHECSNDGVNLHASSALINNNHIYNNAGNGIEIYNDESLIYNNVIENNQSYGVYIYNNSTPDLGGGNQSSPGNNTISGNGTYEVYNASPNNIFAKYNHWDSQSEGEMAGGYYNTVNVTRIWDKWEDGSKGYIMWSDPNPTKTAAPSIGLIKATFYPSANSINHTKAR